jgi:hypothetical protein
MTRQLNIRLHHSPPEYINKGSNFLLPQDDPKPNTLSFWKDTLMRLFNELPPNCDWSQETPSNPILSVPLPRSPTEDPVHLSRLNAGVGAQDQVKLSEDLLGKDRHFESSLTSEALKSSCQATQSAFSPFFPVGITGFFHYDFKRIRYTIRVRAI